MRRADTRITWADNLTPRVGETPCEEGQRQRGSSRRLTNWRQHGPRGLRVEGCAAQQGSREDEPQGREWLKQVTGSGGEQTAKVAENGEGGPKRAWKPATRRSVGEPERSGTSQMAQRLPCEAPPGLRREVYPPD
jgi:hypothetical protein